MINNIIDEIKKEVDYTINNFDENSIIKLSQLLCDTKGNIYFCGVGKSGNIAKHCCDLLKCISFPSFYLDILNSTHGDIGTITSKDIIVMFSNSGNTIEIINIIPLFKNIGVKTVGISCNKLSKFKDLCDLNIIIPFNNEISGVIDKIPTNSCMSQLIFCNILVSVLKKNVTIEKYKQNHLSGNIGKQLLTIKDIIITKYPKIIFKENITLTDILIEMTKYKIGCCFFVNDKEELIGILTDGDIRRLLIRNKFQYIDINFLNKTYLFETNINKYITECKKSMYIPVILNKKIKGIVINQ